MVDINTFREIALSFPETTEQAHFEKPSFRVGKKIFATFDIKNNLACIKLSEIDQEVFSLFDKSAIYPVPNIWGKNGWTYINLNKVRKDMFIEALTTAYCEVAPKKLSYEVKLKGDK
ncbi:MAG: MmcQ/YjbR family DNA-binding protein [Bacteroidota bacterium]|nr:MmcQ/YjbR family DNA-binding protein [Bacteroidota bacterium]